MNAKAQASAKSFLKYILWTAVAAALTTAVNELPKIDLPPIWIPIIAAALKSAATWAATQQD